MRKILWIPQLTTIDGYENLIIHRMNKIINELHTDFKFFVMLPCENDEEYNFRSLVSTNTCIIESTNQPIHKYALHYDFDFSEFCNILTSLKPDFVINNFPALTRNAKTAVHIMKTQTKIVSFLHSFDDNAPFDVSSLIRNIEGVLCADIVVFPDKNTAHKTLDSIDNLLPDLKLLLNPHINDEYYVWDSIHNIKTSLICN